MLDVRHTVIYWQRGVLRAQTILSLCSDFGRQKNVIAESNGRSRNS